MSTPSAPQPHPEPTAAPQDAPQWPTPAAPHPAWQDAPAAQGHPPAAPAPAAQPPAVATGAEVTAIGVPTEMPPPPAHVWTVMSSTKRGGWWRVPDRFSTSVLMGDVRLDLREAQLSGPVTTIEVHGLMGEVKVIVPDTCRVECTGSPIMGDFETKDVDAAPDPGPAAPLIRVTGSILMGSVTVYRTGAPVGQGTFSIDGLKGVRRRREHRRGHR